MLGVGRVGDAFVFPVVWASIVVGLLLLWILRVFTYTFTVHATRLARRPGSLAPVVEERRDAVASGESAVAKKVRFSWWGGLHQV